MYLADTDLEPASKLWMGILAMDSYLYSIATLKKRLETPHDGYKF